MNNRLFVWIAGVALVLFGGYWTLEDILYKDPRPQSVLLLAVGLILVAVGVISAVNSRKAKQEAAEAEKKKQAELEAARQAHREQIRQGIEADEAELERLENGDNIERVYRLTHCVSPSVQETLLLCYEEEKVRFSGDDEHDDVVWIVDKYDNNLGRLPKDAAAKYLEEGALGAFIEELADEDGVTIPFVRVFWKRV